MQVLGALVKTLAVGVIRTNIPPPQSNKVLMEGFLQAEEYESTQADHYNFRHVESLPL